MPQLDISFTEQKIQVSMGISAQDAINAMVKNKAEAISMSSDVTNAPPSRNGRCKGFTNQARMSEGQGRLPCRGMVK